VNLIYKFLFDKFTSSFHLGAVKDKVCDSLAPSKVIVFSWQLLQHRLPTGGNLFWGGGLVGEERTTRSVRGAWVRGNENTYIYKVEVCNII
jgi:hypothetical protein